MLSIQRLSAGYGETRVLNGVNLEVPEGKLVVISGPNGHGKTTLFRVLSGLVPARSGSVTFQGESLIGLPPAEIVGRGLVHVPQGDLLFQDLSVEQNLLMGAYLKDAWKQRSESLERVFAVFPKLKERRKQQARTLSGGERRMCAIGRGLMSRAKLLMVDEPALGLAPLLVQEVYATLAEIVRGHSTVFLAEESFENIEGVADYVYLMTEGEIVLEGEVGTLLRDDRLKSVYLGA
jgi:branched-chain amino acid transport system ATP-binding protein